MSNSQTQPEPSKLTPQELADNLDDVVDTIYKLAKSNNPYDEWAKSPYLKYMSFRGEHPRYLGNTGVALTIDELDRLFPKFYTQIIKPAIDHANIKATHYQQPEKPKYIILDKENPSMAYDPVNNYIKLGIPHIRILETHQELQAIISHEQGHAFQRTINLDNDKWIASCPSVRKLLEYDADRYSEPKNFISALLSGIIYSVDNYKYDDSKDSNCPNNRNRIKALLEERLGNDIFRFNGEWKPREGDNSCYFSPYTIANAPNHSHIKSEIRKKMGGYKSEYEKYTITEDGSIVKNWSNIQKNIEKKSDELMQNLDILVENGFDISKKHQWLELIEKEITYFKEKSENQPDFLDLKKLRSVKLADRMQRNSLSKQRGG